MTEKNNSQFVKFCVILILVNLLLVFGWVVIRQRNDNQKLLKEMAQVRNEVSALQNEMKKLVPNVKAEIQQSVELAKEEILITEAEAVLVKNYRNSIANIASIKLILSEYFMTEGKFPVQITSELIGDVHQYETGVVDSIQVVTGDIPRIIVNLKNLEGEKTGGYYLDGRYLEAGSVNWDCKAFGDLLLKRALPECEYILK